MSVAQMYGGPRHECDAPHQDGREVILVDVLGMTRAGWEGMVGDAEAPVPITALRYQRVHIFFRGEDDNPMEEIHYWCEGTRPEGWK